VAAGQERRYEDVGSAPVNNIRFFVGLFFTAKTQGATRRAEKISLGSGY